MLSIPPPMKVDGRVRQCIPVEKRERKILHLLLNVPMSIYSQRKIDNRPCDRFSPFINRNVTIFDACMAFSNNVVVIKWYIIRYVGAMATNN